MIKIRNGCYINAMNVVEFTQAGKTFFPQRLSSKDNERLELWKSLGLTLWAWYKLSNSA